MMKMEARLHPEPVHPEPVHLEPVRQGRRIPSSLAGTQNSLELTLGLRYTINKRFAMHVDYMHSAISSLGSTPGYSRNRYFAGLTYTY